MDEGDLFHVDLETISPESDEIGDAECGYGEEDGDDGLVDDDYDPIGLALGVPVAEIINHY